MGSDMGISLGYRAWAGLITQTDASCHRNLLPIPTWKVQNKNLQGIPPQKRSHMGIYITWSQGFFAEHQPDQSTTARSDILLSKFPQFKVEKLKMEIRKGFPIRQVQTQAYHLNIWLGLGLDLDLHY